MRRASISGHAVPSWAAFVLIMIGMALPRMTLASPGPLSETNWPEFLGGADSSQFSALDQINRENIGNLIEAWRYEFPGNGQSFGNPLVIEGRMYLPWSGGVVALDAQSGEELWRHDAPGVYMRGLSVWTSPDTGSRRLFFNLNDRLHALDATTGEIIESFGEEGSIDLRAGMGRDPESMPRMESQSPGRVHENLIIVGSTGGFGWDDPTGHIRAFDVRTGELVWIFHTIPQPGEPNYGGWPEGAWKTVGGVKNWTGSTIDRDNGILFVPLSSANYNFYGVNRAGDNLYANSLVALDAGTGRYLWHFQTVHHDLWDYDLPQAPKLLTLRRGDERIEAVAVAGKTGFVYTFDRITGEPVFPMEERPVPQSDVPGEESSPTQPFPIAPPPFARQRFTIEELSPYLDPADRKALEEMLAGLRNEGLFTPPSFEGSVAMPGTSGGTNWGNGVADAGNGRLYLVSHEVPSILKLEPASEGPPAHFLTAHSPAGSDVYKSYCSSCHGEDRAGQPPAIPALQQVATWLSTLEAREIIRRGRATMPGFQIPEEGLASLLEYLGYDLEAIEASAQPSEPHQHANRVLDEDSPIRFKSGYNFLFSQAGLPANSPPWSALTALDMNSGELLWQVPYGQLPGLNGSGTIFPRGAIVGTAGGFLLAGNQDRVLRAWNVDNGEVILERPLPSIPGGVPAVYAVEGRQFIAVPAASYDPKTAGQAPKGMMPEGINSLVVYALPARKK